MEVLTKLFTVDWASSAFSLAMPLFLVAVGALICERSGVLNIATEGMMLGGAYVAVATAVAFGGNIWLGLIGGIIGGVLVGVLLAALTVWIKADQVVIGVAINIFLLGLTTLLYDVFLITPSGQVLARTPAFPIWSIPVLSDIPVLGPFLFIHEPPFYIALVILPVVTYVLFRTRIGLTLRAVGEHARAADTLGIRVTKVRYYAVLACGSLAGLGGAFLALNVVHGFIENVTAGRGYIALAVVILGRWNPLGALAAAFLFGGAEALQYRVQGLGLPISPEVPNMIPYVLALVTLLGIVGRSRPPAEDGKPYIEQEA
jgi:general nucleoside transport system permease protein